MTKVPFGQQNAGVRTRARTYQFRLPLTRLIPQRYLSKPIRALRQIPSP